MSWFELRIVIDRVSLDRVSEFLFTLGATGLQEDHLPGQAPEPRQPWDRGPSPPLAPRLVLVAWFEDADRLALDTSLRATLGEDIEASWSDVVIEDWESSWKDGFEPIRISDRLVVAPPWNAPEGAVIIEPGQGFGTGLHPTTRQALQSLDALGDGLESCIDVGCGSGVLAIVAARMGMTAQAIDIDAASVDETRRNAACNGVVVNASTTPVGDLAGSADIVLANLFAEALVEMADTLVRLTGRHLVLAGVLEDRADRVEQVFGSALRLRRRDQDGEWVGFVFDRDETL